MENHTFSEHNAMEPEPKLNALIDFNKDLILDKFERFQRKLLMGNEAQIFMNFSSGVLLLLLI